MLIFLAIANTFIVLLLFFILRTAYKIGMILQAMGQAFLFPNEPENKNSKRQRYDG